jgi:2-(3-amino-3-carboxypropyl)histidine synthase
MKTAFLIAKSTADVTLPPEVVARLPERVGIVTTVQHLHKMAELKRQLPKAVFAGQVFGCRADQAQRRARELDGFLYIGTGEFHPYRVALATGKPVWCWNPVTKQFSTLDQQEVERYRKRRQAAVARFLMARKVGILISVKPGQNEGRITQPDLNLKLRAALALRKRGDREYYLFAFDTLSRYDLENFNSIDCWVNTACNRIFDDKIPNLVNIEDVLDALGMTFDGPTATEPSKPKLATAA